MTGPKLYLFVKYYLSLGWGVIIYDRFGAHREFIADLISQFSPSLPLCSSDTSHNTTLPRCEGEGKGGGEGLSHRQKEDRGPWLRYHPFTIMQQVHPSKYNQAYLRREVSDALHSTHATSGMR
jgi:hypothetical protein